MHKSIKLVVPVALSLVLGACGHNNAKSAKAKVAVAKKADNGTKKKTFKDIESSIAGSVEKLHDKQFFGMDDNYSVDGATAAIKGTNPADRNEIKNLLSDIKGQAEALEELAPTMNADDAKKASARASELKKRAVSSISRIEREEKVTAGAQSVKDAVTGK